MKLSSEELRRVYREETARRVGPGGECPKAEVFLQAALGKMATGERDRMTDHLIICSDCAEEYRLIASTMAQPKPVATMPDAQQAPSPCPRFPVLRVAAIAASIVILVGASFLVWRAARPAYPPPEDPRGAGSLVLEVEPKDRTALAEIPRRLSWSPVEPAESYQVILYDFESTPIWESAEVKETSIAIPQAVRQTLGHGKPIFWRVIARQGVERRRSALFQFVIPQ
jgi:hypothetical protein